MAGVLAPELHIQTHKNLLAQALAQPGEVRVAPAEGRPSGAVRLPQPRRSFAWPGLPVPATLVAQTEFPMNPQLPSGEQDIEFINTGEEILVRARTVGQ